MLLHIYGEEACAIAVVSMLLHIHGEEACASREMGISRLTRLRSDQQIDRTRRRLLASP